MFCYVVPIQERWLFEIFKRIQHYNDNGTTVKSVASKLTLSADIFAISLDDFKVNEEEGISHGHISAEIQRNWDHFTAYFLIFTRNLPSLLGEPNL